MIMKGEVIELTTEMLAEICKREPRFKKVLKGYDGPVVAFQAYSFGPMLLPNDKRIIEEVSFMWPFVVFGACGDTPFKKGVAREIAKRLNGKVYSVKNLAQLV